MKQVPDRKKVEKKWADYLLPFSDTVNVCDIILGAWLLWGVYTRWIKAEPAFGSRAEALMGGAMLGRLLYLLRHRLQRSELSNERDRVDQTTKHVPDRKRLRREYVQKKSIVYTRMIISLILACIMIGTFRNAVINTQNIHSDYITFVNSHGNAMYPPEPSPIAYYVGVSVILVSGLLVCWSALAFKKGITESLHLAQLPSVTADALSAEEILVRGSEQPPIAQSEVLLRAAKEQETPKEELLRVSQD